MLATTIDKRASCHMTMKHARPTVTLAPPTISHLVSHSCIFYRLPSSLHNLCSSFTICMIAFNFLPIRFATAAVMQLAELAREIDRSCLHDQLRVRVCACVPRSRKSGVHFGALKNLYLRTRRDRQLLLHVCMLGPIRLNCIRFVNFPASRCEDREMGPLEVWPILVDLDPFQRFYRSLSRTKENEWKGASGANRQCEATRKRVDV
jgi:hypothetical protein